MLKVTSSGKHPGCSVLHELAAADSFLGQNSKQRVTVIQMAGDKSMNDSLGFTEGRNNVMLAVFLIGPIAGLVIMLMLCLEKLKYESKITPRSLAS